MSEGTFGFMLGSIFGLMAWMMYMWYAIKALQYQTKSLGIEVDYLKRLNDLSESRHRTIANDLFKLRLLVSRIKFEHDTRTNPPETES